MSVLEEPLVLLNLLFVDWIDLFEAAQLTIFDLVAKLL